MKISLRRAKSLQQAIASKLSELVVKTTVVLDEHVPDVPEYLDKLAKKALDTVELKGELNRVLYDIRARVGAQNADGVNAVLSKLALLEKLKVVYSEIASVTPREEQRVIASRIEKLRATSGTTMGYGANTSFSATVLTAAEIDAAKEILADINRSITKAQDELLDLNVRNQIELMAPDVALLTKHGLL